MKDSVSMIVLHHIHSTAGEKITLSSDASVQTIPLDQVKFSDAMLLCQIDPLAFLKLN